MNESLRWLQTSAPHPEQYGERHKSLLSTDIKLFRQYCVAAVIFQF